MTTPWSVIFQESNKTVLLYQWSRTSFKYYCC